ncbi:MAG: pimeloyl-ACP methyl ester carboxylesterase [Flavobacterium sp.]
MHGALGSSYNYYGCLKDSLLLSKANIYNIDRPGYWFSRFGKAETSIKKQATVVAEIIESLPEEKVIFVWLSYDVPIAACASLQTSKVKSVWMLAPAIDPANEKILGIAYVAKWELTTWMVPGVIAVARDEKFTQIAELIKLAEIWQGVKVPVIHIYGTKEVLVPFENINFSTRKFNKQYLNTIVLKNENHFLPWKRYQFCN